MLTSCALGGRTELHPVASLEQPVADNDAAMLDENTSNGSESISGLEPVPQRDAIPFVQLSKFRHVDGCRICEGLYPHFQLPDGTWAHYYQRDDLEEDVSLRETIAGLRSAMTHAVSQIDGAKPANPTAPVDLHRIFVRHLPVCPFRTIPSSDDTTSV